MRRFSRSKILPRGAMTGTLRTRFCSARRRKLSAPSTWRRHRPAISASIMIRMPYCTTASLRAESFSSRFVLPSYIVSDTWMKVPGLVSSEIDSPGHAFSHGEKSYFDCKANDGRVKLWPKRNRREGPMADGLLLWSPTHRPPPQRLRPVPSPQRAKAALWGPRVAVPRGRPPGTLDGWGTRSFIPPEQAISDFYSLIWRRSRRGKTTMAMRELSTALMISTIQLHLRLRPSSMR